MKEKSVQEVRGEAIGSVMARVHLTSNPVTRYIADAVVEKVLRDEAQDDIQAVVGDNAIPTNFPLTKGARSLINGDFYLPDGSVDLQDNIWSYCLAANCDIDEIFGTHVKASKNGDYINIYAHVIPGYDKVEDCLEILLHKGTGANNHFNYLLSDSEKDCILELVISYEVKRLQRELDQAKMRIASARKDENDAG